jgi:Carboxypeptidase regulatory-like domain
MAPVASQQKPPATPGALAPQAMTAAPPGDTESSEEVEDEELLEEKKDGSGPCIAVEVTARGAPVSGAHVNAARRKGDALIELHPLMLGADGRGQGWCKPGEYVFAAHAPGFGPSVATLEVHESDSTPRVRFELKPGLGLSGRVLDADSREPVAGAELSFSPSDEPEEGEVVDEVSALSDARGTFQVGDLAERSYLVVVTAPGHAQSFAEVEVPRAEPLLISLEGTARLEGQVVDGGGAPVPGAKVEAHNKEPALDGQFEGQADGQGHFSLDVRGGTYVLVATAKGQAALHEGAVTVARGALVDGLVIRLRPSGSLSGRVFVQASQKPVVGADIYIRQAQADFGYSARTDARGGFRAELLPGEYELTLSKDGFPDAERKGLQIQAGQELAVEIPLSRAATVEGCVKDSAGHRSEAAEVTIRWLGESADGEEQEFITGTDEEGEYQYEPLLAGRYQLEARLAEEGRASVREITLQEGETARVDFVVPQQLGEVQGTVRTAEGGPLLDEVEVFMMDTDFVEVDETGHFTARLLPGKYSFKAAYVAADEPGSEQRVTVEAGKVSRVVLTVAGTLTETSGVVLNSRGEPVSGASVELMGEDLHGYEETDAQGSFVVKTSAKSAGTSVFLRASSRSEEGEVRDVLVGSRGVVVRLQPDAALRGRLVPTRGPPVQGFELYAKQEPGTRALFPRGDSRPFVGDSFELVDVPVGALDLWVRTSDGRSGKAQVRLEPGRTVNVEITVGELGRVVGRFAEPGGSGNWVSVDRDKPDERTVRAGRDGRFELFAIEPGEHVLVMGWKKRSFTLREGETLDLGEL